jgi:hypothetical protein
MMEVHQVADGEGQIVWPEADDSKKTQHSYDRNVQIGDWKNSQKAPDIESLQRDGSIPAMFPHQDGGDQKAGKDKEHDESDGSQTADKVEPLKIT